MNISNNHEIYIFFKNNNIILTHKLEILTYSPKDRHNPMV